MSALFPSRLCILDTETTGFQHHDWARVIELGAVVLDGDGVEVAAWESLILPDILDERAAGALAVNKIDLDTLRATGIDPVEASRSFREWLALHDCRFVTAYNVAFDRPMVERHPLGLVDLRWASCVMLRAKAAVPGGRFPGGSLARMAEHFGVAVVGDAHRALTDARTAAGVAVAIRQKEIGL
jgi:DNA polymerase III epsilon subunit-like protein